VEHILLKKVYVILVNWNGWQDTVECIGSLMQLQYDNFKILVCDNGSDNDSINKIEEWSGYNSVDYIKYERTEAESGGDLSQEPTLTLIRNGVNLGFAGGNNVGIKMGLARGDVDYFWLLNNDTIVDADALTQLVNRMQEGQSIGMCGSTICFFNDRKRIQALGGGYYCKWIGLPLHYGRYFYRESKINIKRAETLMNYVEGASMLVSQSFINAVGLMCDEYFLYFEEIDWATRSKGSFTLGYAHRSLVYHKVGSSIGTSINPANKSYLCDFYNISNRIKFAKRYYPLTLPTIYLVLFGEVLLRILCGKFQRASMIIGLMISDSNSKEFGR
jgi:GT2 family glycosyltransferase